MIPTQSLSDRLRERVAVAESESRFGDAEDMREAANALDAKDKEIALLKEGRQLHDELADHKDAEIERLQKAALAAIRKEQP